MNIYGKSSLTLALPNVFWIWYWKHKSPDGTSPNEKDSAYQKKQLRKMKRQATEWERMFTNHISYKELKIYKELMQLNNKKISILKMMDKGSE